MTIIIIAQDDSFVIPRNIEKILSLPYVKVPLVIALNTTGTLTNKKLYFLKGFGFIQAVKMGVRLGAIKAADAIDRIFRWKIFGNKSIRAVAGKYRVSFIKISNPNDSHLLQKISSFAPDLIVSFSAPRVFKRELLSIPRLGCINLHCSLLPLYAGLLPSFWVLYHLEAETGATVHYMDDRIDNGGIIAQQVVPIKKGMSMFDLIHETKKAGGDLVCRTVNSLRTDSIEIKNNTSPLVYYSWPSVEQMKEFRRRGGKLI